MIIALVDEAYVAGARISPICCLIGISIRTLQRWRKGRGVTVDGRKEAARLRIPANKLSEQECAQILNIANKPQYANLPPSQIVPALADRGCYVASESTFYRVLREADQLTHRGKAKPSTHKKPEQLMATGPNQLWSWDITYLATSVKGIFFYLYLIMDIYSRKIVGYEVYEKECGQLASQLLQRCMLKEQCFHQAPPLVLHSDNGAPMKSQTLKAKLEELGVMSSYSRPRVSNDNPFSEALFKTLKYRGDWPSSGFKNLDDARNWVQHFVDWYNHQHKHSCTVHDAD